MTLLAARLKDDHASHASRETELHPNLQVSPLQTTLSELTVVCRHSLPIFVQLVLIYVRLGCTTRSL
jgi:hypothetical protein